MPAQLDKDVLRGVRSPDQLDRAIKLASPANWLANLLLLVVVLSVLAWSVLGTLPTRVTGLGLALTFGGKVFSVTAPQSGSVSEVRVRVGQEVKKGDVIAHIIRGTAIDQLVAEEKKLKALQEQFAESSTRADKLLADRRETNRKLIASVKNKIETYQARLNYLQNTLKQQEADLQAGYITRKEFRQTQDDIDDVHFKISDARQQIANANVDLAEFIDQQRQSLNTQELQLTEQRIQVEQLRADERIEETVTSPVDAKVVEVSVRPGDSVSAGGAIAELLSGGRALVVHGFFRAADGKKIAEGMDARISVSSAEAAIYGTAIGKVVEVSKLPATEAFILDIFGNETLARQMMQDGAPIYVRVEFVPDPSTPSGVAWSSSRGPPFAIDAGTSASVVVTVASEPPINYIAPILPEKLGLAQHGND